MRAAERRVDRPGPHQVQMSAPFFSAVRTSEFCSACRSGALRPSTLGRGLCRNALSSGMLRKQLVPAPPGPRSSIGGARPGARRGASAPRLAARGCRKPAALDGARTESHQGLRLAAAVGFAAEPRSSAPSRRVRCRAVGCSLHGGPQRPLQARLRPCKTASGAARHAVPSLCGTHTTNCHNLSLWCTRSFTASKITVLVPAWRAT